MNVDRPVQVVAQGAIGVDAGNLHACALLEGGQVECFGDSSFGQATVPTLTEPAIALSAGGDNTCVRYASGQLLCWGSNRYGQIQNPTSESEAALLSIDSEQLLGAPEIGQDVFCALGRPHEALCWVRALNERSVPERVSRPVPERVLGL